MQRNVLTSRKLLPTRPLVIVLVLGLSSLGALGGLLHAEYYVRSTGHASVFELSNGFGDLVDALVSSGRYEVCGTNVVAAAGDLCFRAHRLPLVPTVLFAAATVSDDVRVAFVAKNALFFALLALALAIALRQREHVPLAVLLPMLPLFILPYSFFVLTSLEFEEAYVSHLLPVAFIATVIMKRRWHVVIASVATACLVLSKSTLAPLACVLSAFATTFAFARFADWRLRLLPVASVVAALLAWSLYTYVATGRAATIGALTTWDGANLYKGVTGELWRYYPALSPDYLDLHGYTKPDREISDEWTLNDYYVSRARETVAAAPGEFVSGIGRKAWFTFGSVMRLGQSTVADHTVSLSLLMNRLISYTLLFLLIVRALRFGRADRQLAREAVTFAAVSMLYVAPLLIGFAYERHLQPLFALIYVWFITVMVRRSPAT